MFAAKLATGVDRCVVRPLSQVVDVACGTGHVVFAVLDRHSPICAYGFGSNEHGQLGPTGFPQHRTPTPLGWLSGQLHDVL